MNTKSYNTDFIVKYMCIENELRDKHEYTDDEINDVCLQLYQHELLSVFFADDIDDPKITNVMSNLWRKLTECEEFIVTVDALKKKYSQFDENSNDYIFTLMFSYQYFYIIHKCICEYFLSEQISQSVLNKFLD